MKAILAAPAELAEGQSAPGTGLRLQECTGPGIKDIDRLQANSGA